MSIERIPKLTVILGIILIIIAYIIPYDSLEIVLGEGLRPLGLISIFANPILGIIGISFSIYKKQWVFLVFNIALIFTFFILMYIGYALLY